MEKENQKNISKNVILFIPLKKKLKIFDQIEQKETSYKYEKCDPFTKIIESYDEIQQIKKEENVIQLLYFNRENIHQILFEKDDILNIEHFKFEKNLSSCFYLILLIIENPYIVDYIYSLNFIRQINDMQNNIKDQIYKKIILSNIILELINNYSSYNENIIETQEEKINIDNIEKNNNDIIDKYLNVFNNQIGLNMNKKDLISKSLDKIYIEIIIELIKNKKFEDFNFTSDILNQLDLLNIDITKTMFDELSKILDIKNNYISCYFINNENNLLDIKIINFYYFLFHYIFKDPIYIYQNSFLIKVRNNILNIIKNKEVYNHISKLDNNIKNNLFIIIKTFTDSSHYYKSNEHDFENKEIILKKDVIPIKSPVSNTSFKNKPSSSYGISMLDHSQNEGVKQEMPKTKDDPFSHPSYKNRNTNEMGSSMLNKSQNEGVRKEKNINIDDIRYKLITGSSYTFEIKKEGEMSFILKNDNNKFKYNEKILTFTNLKKLKFSNNSDKELEKNYKKFLKIFDDFENYFHQNLKDISNIQIDLEFKFDEEENRNEPYNLSNISLTCKLYKEKEEIDSYKIHKILTLEKIDKDEGFLYLIQEIQEL